MTSYFHNDTSISLLVIYTFFHKKHEAELLLMLRNIKAQYI